MSVSKTQEIVESALMVALAVILSTFVKFEAFWAQGGSVTLFSALPIILISYRYGIKWGMLTGTVFALVQMLLGTSVVRGYDIGSVILVLALDYIVPFALYGLGGIFRNIIKNQSLSLIAGSCLVLLIRFACHTIIGAFVWLAALPTTTERVIGSIIYNGGYMLPELVICCIGAFFIGAFVKNLRAASIA